VLSYYWDYVFGDGHARLPHSHVSLDLTYRCNLRCNMCFLYGRHLAGDNPTLEAIRTRKELTTGEWRHVLDDLGALGVRSLVMSGGEVFLKRGFLDLLAAARSRGFAVSVLTNGTMIGPEEARGLVAHQPRFVRFSLDGDRDTHDAICVRPSYDRLLAGIGLIRDEQRRQGRTLPELGFETVIQRRNQDRLCHVIEAAHANGIRRVTISNIFFTAASEPAGCGSCEVLAAGQTMREVDSEIYAVDAQVLDRELRKVRARAAELGVEVTCRLRGIRDIERVYGDPDFSYLSKCFYPWMMFRINPYGDVIPCTGSTRSMGNVAERPVAEVWNGEPFCSYRRELKREGLFDECRKCNTLADARWRVWNWLPRV
jgi:radical SAM protein with 4Fe4S-binding SPASM domain